MSDENSSESSEQPRVAFEGSHKMDPISLPLYSPDLLYAMQKTVKGFQPHPTGFHYGLRFAWLDR